MNVPIPVMPPRTKGLPRPVSSPVSESPSENAIEMPAPIEKTTNRLPAGRAPLLAFVSDSATEKALRDCLTQLSLAHGMIARGGIAKAVETLGAERSPNILIVDITGVDLPVSQVDALAEVCEPGVTVIAIGNRSFARSSALAGRCGGVRRG